MLSIADLQMWKRSVCSSGCLGLTKVCVTVQWMIIQYVMGYRECEDSRDQYMGYFAGQGQIHGIFCWTSTNTWDILLDKYKYMGYFADDTEWNLSICVFVLFLRFQAKSLMGIKIWHILYKGAILTMMVEQLPCLRNFCLSRVKIIRWKVIMNIFQVL